MTVSSMSKADKLHNIARNYVIKGLGSKNFDAIPYAENVVLRTPLSPGGLERPLTGKENLRSQWWAPLPSLLAAVEIVDSYVNKEETGVVVEFYCRIINPACTLRVIDRFIINEEGNIIDQENFFDPRPVTNPM
ncbi:MAG: hypothetical protein ABIN89_26375 [Chitinophagaceae bacterium]